MSPASFNGYIMASAVVADAFSCRLRELKKEEFGEFLEHIEQREPKIRDLLTAVDDLINAVYNTPTCCAVSKSTLLPTGLNISQEIAAVPPGSDKGFRSMTSEGGSARQRRVRQRRVRQRGLRQRGCTLKERALKGCIPRAPKAYAIGGYAKGGYAKEGYAKGGYAKGGYAKGGLLLLGALRIE